MPCTAPRVGLAATPSPFDKLVGLPVGSRVLLLVPAKPQR